MVSIEVFHPGDGQEKERLLIVEHAFNEGGLVDKHLRWVELGVSPTAEITKEEYGYVPPRFNVPEEEDPVPMRPSREGIDLREIATGVLGTDYDIPEFKLAKRVHDVDEGWFKYLGEEGILDPGQIAGMREAAEGAFSLDILTEDNLTAYVKVLEKLMTLAAQYGISVPALEEWGRGIWPAEEDRHKLGMNDYGQKLDIINNKVHGAGRNSQIRSGIDVDPQHITEFFVYVAWQEFSTYIAHHRNGVLFGPVGNELLQDISGDESRHHGIYFGGLKAIFEAYPDITVRTLNAVLPKPYMPGKRGIPQYKQRAMQIDRSGVFGREQSVEAARVLVKKLGLLSEDFDAAQLSADGVLALTALRELYLEEKEYKSKGAFVLGKTIGITELNKIRKSYQTSAAFALANSDY